MMGEIFTLKCSKCGYTFNARYGGGRNDYKNDIRLKRLLEAGKGKRHIQIVYDALKATVEGYELEYNEELINSYKQDDGFDLEEATLQLQSPRVGSSMHLYECEQCKRFFNHRRITFYTYHGVFSEEYTNCKYCKAPYAFPVEREEIKPKLIDGTLSYKNVSWCPKCHGELDVKEWIIID